MSNQVNSIAGCLLIGEYVDENECSSNAALQRSEVVRPQVVANFLDFWGLEDGLREFTVLLKDGLVVAVRGHSLKHEPHPLAGQDVFRIVVRNRAEEISVALFKSADVAGIFHGEMLPDRKIA